MQKTRKSYVYDKGWWVYVNEVIECLSRHEVKMLKIKSVILLVCLSLVGCYSIPQGMYDDHQHSLDGNSFSFDNDSGYGLLTINYQKQDILILKEKSYAISPKGIRYEIDSKPHNYLQEGRQFPPYRIYFKSTSGKPLNELAYGKWQFYFTYELEDKSQHDVNFNFNVTRFYYIPFIHGAPN